MLSIYTQAITTDEAFHQLDALYHQCFGEASVPTDTLYSWYRTYPQGLTGLFKDDLLIGGLSIWALQPSAFERFSSGKIKEKELHYSYLQTTSPRNYFYLSEIAILETERDKTRLIPLLNALKDHLLQHASWPAQVLALAYSPEGLRVMTRLGFLPLLDASLTVDQQALLRWDIPAPEGL